MPLLIERVENNHTRRGSLKPLWTEIHHEINQAAAKPITRASVQVLDAREVDWLRAEVQISEAKLKLSHSGQIFARVDMCGAIVIGHIAKRHIQVIESKQTFLFKLRTHSEYIDMLATLLLWSNVRRPGLENKIFTPPVPEPKIEEDPILVCTVECTENEQGWYQTTAVLKKSGFLDLGELTKAPSHSVSVRQLDSKDVRCVDASIAGPRVLYVNGLYLRFASDADLDDWFVSLRSFTKQKVYAPLPPDCLKSVRRVANLKIQGISLRISRDHPALSPQNPGSIEADDLDFSNTYMEFLFDNAVYGRTYLHTTAEVPFWMQNFQFIDIPGSPMVVNLKYSESGTIDNTNISIGAAVAEDGKDWIVLDNPSVPISVNVQLSTENQLVLGSSYYKELRKQTLDLSAGLAYKLGNVVPQDMAQLCDTFFHIYLAERKPTEWIEFLIASEIEEASHRENSTATMFRGNSMMTRGIEKYLQTIGRRVLEKTVGRFVRKVLNTNDTFELDPARVAASLSAQGQPNDAAAVEKVVTANRITITNYMVFIWTLIRKEPLPDHFKWVFTFLAETMRTKLGVTNQDVIYSAVSAFLFLRFYCPALLNPQLFNLFESAVTPANQRALTLVAKLLQGFANRVKFGAKEPWLMPMNSFLEKYEGDLTDWYSSLVSFNGQRPKERDAKEAPLQVYMDNQLSNPFLIDEWANFAKLSKWGSLIHFDKSWDLVLTKFFVECKRVNNDLQDILNVLEAPDSIEGNTTPPELHVNWDKCLFSNDKHVLEEEKIPRPEKKRVWSKLMGR